MDNNENIKEQGIKQCPFYSQHKWKTEDEFPLDYLYAVNLGYTGEASDLTSRWIIHCSRCGCQGPTVTVQQKNNPKYKEEGEALAWKAWNDR